MKKAANNTSIKVFCRLRPLNRLEKEQGGECCVQHSDKSIKVKVAGSENTNDFTFDAIFGSDCTQIDVFNTVAKPVIDGLFDGYNGTIFAYGQTSSGKTFTMEGPDLIDTEEKLGIIPRMMKYVFSLIMNSSEDIEFNVKVSFLELYNEKLQDLIDPRKNNLQIKEDKAKGIFVQDATEVYVTSAEQMQQVHKSGSENRTIAATRMNERSSRSHSIFVLYVNQKNTKTDTTKHSKLYFVDLAGSEKISKTNVTGQQLEEAKNINKSLTALGLVINALTEKDKGHVPYRDSKLTRLLQESLGGNSQTSLILACSMCSYNDKEIVDTLRFGYRAKSIKNTPIVNAEKSAKELTILLNAAEKRIQDQETLIQSLQLQVSSGVIVRPVELMSPRSIETEIKKEEDSSQTEEAKRNQNSKPQKSGASSMTLFKHQMELTNLREQIEELKSSNKDLETELSTKNQEIYDLNGKIMQYEQQISEFSSKNNLAIEEYQVHLEKLYNENQEKTMLTNKFKRAISRLKSDLNFVFLTKHLKSLEAGDTSTSTLETTMMTNEKESSRQTNKDELLVNSIQRTIEVLEEVEREVEENEKKTNLNEEMENIIDALMKNSFSNSLIKDNDKSGPPFQFRTDLLAPEAEDDIKAINWMTESSGENKESLGLLDNLKLDGDNDDDFAQKMQMQFQSLSEDDKVNELHALVANQRKMITNLTKLNNELTQANQKHQASNEKNVTLYKSKLEELQKINTDKTKEYDSKIQGLKMLLETKINELEETKATNDKYLLAKVQMISELKQQNDTLQNLISGNDAALRSFELETTLKEVMVERKKLAEEILKLRREVDEKEDAISKKTTQIESLQDNLGLAAKEIKTLKQFKPANFEMTSAPKESARGAPKTKVEFNLFDKHVVKPIRGGGGDANNFAKNNFFTFDKPNRVDFQPEDKKPIKSEVKTPRSVTFNFNPETPRGAKLLDDQNMKKFDDLLKQKRGSQPALVKPIAGLRVQTEIDEEDEEVDMVQIQQKLKTITARNVTTTKQQKSTTSFFGNVRNLFS